VRTFRTRGSIGVYPKGGDQRSHQVEAHRAVILDAIASQVDITLVELADLLASEQDRPDVRARQGQRCRSPVLHGHWKTATFTGTLRLIGMTAPTVLDGQ